MTNKRKGVTLAEMCIVMAVIAIVSLSVVSFVTITSGRGSASAAKMNAMEELELVESIVDNWFVQMTQNHSEAVDNQGNLRGNSIQVVNSRTVQGSVAGYIKKESTLNVCFPGNAERSYSLEKITDIHFDYRENGEDVLYFCTVTYEDDGETAKYVFCINPRVGEIIGGTPDDNTNNNQTPGGETGDNNEEVQ